MVKEIQSSHTQYKPIIMNANDCVLTSGCFLIRGMIEKLLANPFAGDGTLHPDLHLIYVDEVCGLFKLAGMPEDVIKKKVFPLYLEGEALTWFRLCDDMDHGTTTD